jgi:hypothetical protein
MLATVAHVLLGLVLLVSAAAKLAAPRATQAAMATFGLEDPRARTVAWTGAVVAEAGLGVAVALGVDAAAWAAAALLLAFAALLARALRGGAAGRPCGCLGARSRVSRAALARTLVLALAFALVGLVPDSDPPATTWLAIALGAVLVAVAGLGLLVVALARELGELRLAIGPSPALEIPGEGPPLGSHATAAIARFGAVAASARFAVAVFASDGCSMCQALEPSIRLLANDPLLAVEVFDEVADASVWRALAIPGSPYAVVLALDGAVLAQGTFNSLRQLESLVATAAQREREAFEALHV